MIHFIFLPFLRDGKNRLFFRQELLPLNFILRVSDSHDMIFLTQIYSIKFSLSEEEKQFILGNIHSLRLDDGHKLLNNQEEFLSKMRSDYL